MPCSFGINGVLECGVDLVFLCVIRFLYIERKKTTYRKLRLLTLCVFVLRIAHRMHQRAMARAFSATPMLIQATATWIPGSWSKSHPAT